MKATGNVSISYCSSIIEYYELNSIRLCIHFITELMESLFIPNQETKKKKHIVGQCERYFDSHHIFLFIHCKEFLFQFPI